MEPLPVVVVSPDPLARAGIAALVAGRQELALAGQGAPRDAARLVADRPDVVLLADLGQDAVGADAFGDALASLRAVALVPDAAGAAAALRAGAHAVLLRDAPPEEIAAALVAAARGLTVLDHALAEAFLRTPRPLAHGEPLTAREREVLSLLAEGLANKAIAERLAVSEHTAKFHVNAILQKLGASSRSDAIVRAARMGLILL